MNGLLQFATSMIQTAPKSGRSQIERGVERSAGFARNALVLALIVPLLMQFAEIPSRSPTIVLSVHNMATRRSPHRYRLLC